MRIYQIALFAGLANSIEAKHGFRLKKGGKVGKTAKKDSKVCKADEPTWNEATAAILSTVQDASGVLAGLIQYQEEGLTIGSTTALIPEASDAAASGAPIKDGKSGDTDFPFGPLKPIVTVGERSVCSESTGQKFTGVPDGLGAYLYDDETIRLIVQGESYGPLEYGETWPFPVNHGAATFTGSHVQYVDYIRSEFEHFMSGNTPASSMVVGFGQMIQTSYNLKGDLVGPRNITGPTEVGAHYSNTDVDGNYVVAAVPSEADWLLQSTCSAHLEQQHQWGPGIGLEDDIFITNEEWNNYVEESLFVGIGSHAIDIENKIDYALGCFGLSGFEKAVELNPQNPNYVVFAVSGYNGDFDGNTAVLKARNEEYGKRPDGSDYVWPQNIVPYRIYVGVKGKMEDGSDAPKVDFLARNGLRYGQLYGFAVDMGEDGPTRGLWRDAFHEDSDKAYNGAKVPGKWFAVDWRWKGEVMNFKHDNAWEFQIDPPAVAKGKYGFDNYKWWNSAGYDESGLKTEHVTPDPRPDTTAFIQGSTAGYFGHLYVNDVPNVLAKADGDLPRVFSGTYYVYQGVRDVSGQIHLGGKGQYTEGRDATRNWKEVSGEGLTNFDNVDGLEVFYSADGNLYLLIQEDSGNLLGERMFITGPLEHDDDGHELDYYFIAMSGGELNSRVVAGVGIPAGTNCEVGPNEFSGAFDMSGLLRRDTDHYYGLSAGEEGWKKRHQDSLVDINDKLIILGLQAHEMNCGLIEAFQADRSGQVLVYKPDLPV